MTADAGFNSKQLQGHPLAVATTDPHTTGQNSTSDDGCCSDHLSRYHNRKQWFDRTAALAMLTAASPVIVFLVGLIRLTSPGPAIYRQVRLGRGQRVYTMYKLRSMRIDAEKAGPQWSQAGDPRVTWLGFWLRRLHLDELPQLINVLRGDMALIGPRPERPEFVKVLTKYVDGYAHRMDVLPGITGLAQINLPPDSDLDSVRRKIVLDREYIETASLWLDIRILMCTVLRLIGLSGQLAIRATGLQRQVELPASTEHEPSPSIGELMKRESGQTDAPVAPPRAASTTEGESQGESTPSPNSGDSISLSQTRRRKAVGAFKPASSPSSIRRRSATGDSGIFGQGVHKPR